MNRVGASTRDGWHLPVHNGVDMNRLDDVNDLSGLDDDLDSGADLQQPPGVIANWGYLSNALRRERRTWLGLALAGLLVAVAGLLVLPSPHQATALVVLAHDPLVDPSRAMETDLGLATTRAVAEGMITELGLDTTPEKVLDHVQVTSNSADSAEFTYSASSDAEAVRRLTAYVQVYLTLRSAQVTAQSDALAAGTKDRIAELQKQADELSKRVDALNTATGAGSALLGDLIGQRSQLVAQMSSLQQTQDDAQLRSASIVAASRVVDAPSAEPVSTPVRIVLWTLTGLLAGGALGILLVLSRAMTTTRLRRRDEISLALRAPVLVGVGRIEAAVGRWKRLVRRVSSLLTLGRTARARSARQETDRRRLAQAIRHAYPQDGWRQRLVIGCIDNADQVAEAVLELADSYAAAGRNLHLIDLSERGVLAAAPVPVIRPDDVPSLAEGPREVARRAGMDEARLEFPTDGSAVLVLADLHPAVGADHLLPWAEQVIVAVTAGRSDAERIDACARMLRTAGLRVRGAAVLNTDPTDASVGSEPVEVTAVEGP